MADTLEVELKLRADAAALEELAKVPGLGPADLGPPRAVDELDRYLDTVGGALAAARWACRLRSREGRSWISLKGPAQHAAGDSVHRRPEVEGPAPDDPSTTPHAWPVSPARDLVLRLAGPQPLREVLRLRQHRLERALLVGGRRVAVLSLDDVTVEHDGRDMGAMRVVELEVDSAISSDAIEPVFAALRERDGLRPEPASKLERALEMVQRESEAAG
jgi:inorganic triphosphatase YgiF